MRYKITHTTTYTYTDLVPICHNVVHLTPRDARRQNCMSHRIAITPRPATFERRSDYFGNPLYHFSIVESHKRLAVRAVSRVEVKPLPLPAADKTPPWETIRNAVHETSSPLMLDALQYTFASPSISIPSQVRDYALTSFEPGKPVLSAIEDLTSRIHHDFTYDPRATTVSTPVDEVLELKRGVCQDFAHFQISALRSIGIPARYVSGYLRTIPAPGRPRLVGADASHAWLSVYCGEAGWIDVDPTNDCVVNTDHITVAWGRDYNDVCPIRGVFIGGGTHRMAVSVDVLPLDPVPEAAA